MSKFTVASFPYVELDMAFLVHRVLNGKLNKNGVYTSPIKEMAEIMGEKIAEVVIQNEKSASLDVEIE